MTSASQTSSLPHPAEAPQLYQGVPLRRGVAWVLDMVLIAVLSALVLPFTAFTGVFFFPFLMLVIGFFYRWFTIAGGSSTWGMRLTGIELREADGARLAGSTAFWHTVGYSISVAMAPLQLISIVMMLVTERGQGLSDTILGTVALNRGLR